MRLKLCIEKDYAGQEERERYRRFMYSIVNPTLAEGEEDDYTPRFVSKKDEDIFTEMIVDMLETYKSSLQVRGKIMMRCHNAPSFKK